MSIDLSKLLPAPWAYSYDGSGDWSVGCEHEPQEARAAVVSDGDDDFCRAHAAFIALAKNAFDVMMRRGWGVEQWEEGWSIAQPKRPWQMPGDLCWPDPFTALVEADRWYQENVEKP